MKRLKLVLAAASALADLLLIRLLYDAAAFYRSMPAPDSEAVALRLLGGLIRVGDITWERAGVVMQDLLHLLTFTAVCAALSAAALLCLLTWEHRKAGAYSGTEPE